jgi:hypothetical protein
VIFFTNVNTNKANSSQQIYYKVRSHDLRNLLHSYYYVKKVLQFVRLVINIRVEERVYLIFKNKVHSILMQRDAWYKTWYMRGVSYAILTLQNSCTVSCLLPSLETLHSIATKKKHSPVHGCCRTWGCVVRNKTKRWRNETAVLLSLKKYSQCYSWQKYLPYSWNFVCDYKTTPHFLDDKLWKKIVLY